MRGKEKKKQTHIWISHRGPILYIPLLGSSQRGLFGGLQIGAAAFPFFFFFFPISPPLKWERREMSRLHIRYSPIIRHGGMPREDYDSVIHNQRVQKKVQCICHGSKWMYSQWYTWFPPPPQSLKCCVRILKGNILCPFFLRLPLSLHYFQRFSNTGALLDLQESFNAYVRSVWHLKRHVSTTCTKNTLMRNDGKSRRS